MSPSYSSAIEQNAELVYNFGQLVVYRVCDLDLICMKLISYRDKDRQDIKGLLADNPEIRQYMIQDEMQFLYGDSWVDKISSAAIRFVRSRVKR